MPNNWLAVDSNLPDLSRVKDPKEQIQQLFNYMVELTQQLRFSLSNLSVSNWNTTALDQMKELLNEETLVAVQRMDNRITQLNTTVSAANGLIYGIEGEITRLQDGQGVLSEDVKRLQEVVSGIELLTKDLEDQLNNETGILKQLGDLQAEIDGLAQELEMVKAGIQKTEDGFAIGSEGGALYLKGTVYINGVLLEQKEGTE